MGTIVTILHVFVCVFLVLLVLLQQGKGADTSATFGGGSQTVFGASGADTLLTKVTTFCAVLFMCTSVVLTMRANKLSVTEGSIFQNMTDEQPTKDVAAPTTETKDDNSATGAASGTVKDSATKSPTSDTPSTPPAQ